MFFTESVDGASGLCYNILKKISFARNPKNFFKKF